MAFKISVELTSDEFCLLSFALGSFAGQSMKQADECRGDVSERHRYRDRAEGVHKLFQKLQEGQNL